MKRNMIIRLVILGILVMSLCSCTKKINETTTDNELWYPMTLIINNEVHSMDKNQDQANAPQSRAIDVGFATKFVSGDKTGVLVSKRDGTFENIEFTYNGTNWLPTTTLKYYDGATYAVYYPYNRQVANQAAYDQYVTNFTPAINQGTEALYTANDPMSGVGVIGGTTQARTLTASLSHLMGLYVIYPPQSGIVPTFNGGVVPHLIEGSYRLHLKPGSQVAITGSYLINGQNKAFTIPTTTIVANKYSIFNLKDDDTPLPDTKTIKVNGVDFKFILVKKGIFQMGSPANEAAPNTDENQHWVSLTKDYYIAETEVTSAQFLAIIMGEEMAGELGNTTPAENVSSWNTICEEHGFLDIMNEAYNGSDGKFVLPTEAQWEYAARGGHKAVAGYMQYPGTDTDLTSIAFHSNNESPAQPVARKLPNQLGLYDMAGNMNEICRDWYTTSYAGGTSQMTPVVDPFVSTNPGTSKRVMRGGGYNSMPINCRSARRIQHDPSMSEVYATGFRLVLEQ